MKKNKKRKILIIVLIVVVIVLIIGGIILYQVAKLDISIKNNKKININQRVYNTDFIKVKKNGKIVSKKKLVNTSKLGKKEFTVQVKNRFNRVKFYKITITIIDKEPPKIKFNESVSVEEGTEVDLLKDVVVTDNSKEMIKAEVVGTYDINTPGNYELEYVAKDSSGNAKKEKFTLEVTEKKVLRQTSGGYVLNDGPFTTSNGHRGEVINGIAYIDGILIANKTYPLPSTYNPGITAETQNAFNEMNSAANQEGMSLWIQSGFRSYSTQQYLYNNYVAQDGKEEADTYSARPGHSEHQTGLGIDINQVDRSFGYTREGQWLAANAWKFGFILRYPEGKTNETGYIYEPWHFRYVGKDLAAKLYNNGDWITLETYFGITSVYGY